MSPKEQYEVLKRVNRKLAQKLDIQVCSNFNLVFGGRARRRRIANMNKSWTLFINTKGSLCYAVEKRGFQIGPLESPPDKHDLKHEEHALNYFINEFRRVSAPFREVL